MEDYQVGVVGGRQVSPLIIKGTSCCHIIAVMPVVQCHVISIIYAVIKECFHSLQNLEIHRLVKDALLVQVKKL